MMMWFLHPKRLLVVALVAIMGVLVARTKVAEWNLERARSEAALLDMRVKTAETTARANLDAVNQMAARMQQIDEQVKQVLAENETQNKKLEDVRRATRRARKTAQDGALAPVVGNTLDRLYSREPTGPAPGGPGGAATSTP